MVQSVLVSITKLWSHKAILAHFEFESYCCCKSLQELSLSSKNVGGLVNPSVYINSFYERSLIIYLLDIDNEERGKYTVGVSCGAPVSQTG